jgi:hypothetical protein
MDDQGSKPVLAEKCVRTHLNGKEQSMLSVLVFPTMVRSISKKIMVQASLDKK